MSHGLLLGQPAPSPALLEAWLDAHGVMRSSGVALGPMADGTGWRLVATRDLDLGDTICMIPKTTLLSSRTSSLPPIIDPTAGSTTSRPILSLTLALLHELRLGPQSHFWGYTQSLPRETIALPVLWPLDGPESDAAKAMPWLAGTQAARDLTIREKEGLALSDLWSFYEVTGPKMPATLYHPNPSPFIAFAHAYALVSTRAFAIDLYHTVAMCPFADILNHSSASHTSLASDDYVCHICGTLAVCPAHDALYPGHDVPARLAHLGSIERDALARQVDTVDMYVERPVHAGQEVMNCYGEGISDARLLVEWGFVPGSSMSHFRGTANASGSGDNEATKNENEDDYDSEDDDEGEGVTWNIDELCGPAARSQWEAHNQGESLAALLFDTDDLDQDHDHEHCQDPTHSHAGGEVDADKEEDEDEYSSDDTLICAPSARTGVYHLNHAGQISFRLFGAVYFEVSGGGGIAPEGGLVNAHTKIEAAWARLQHQGDGEAEDAQAVQADLTLEPVVLATAWRVRQLIAKRLEGMHMPNLRVGELYDLREMLGSSNPLLAMAMTVALNEKALLLSTLERWNELLRGCGGAQ